jgi:hypothetical protein
MPVLGAPMSGLSNVSNITEEDFAFNILEVLMMPFALLKQEPM